MIDKYLEIVVAFAAVAGSARRSAEHAVAVWDPAEFLVVLVDEGTRMADLGPSGQQRGRLVEIGGSGGPPARQLRRIGNRMKMDTLISAVVYVGFFCNADL